MTLLITINFLARSSSLVPWIPLAVLKIMENSDYFVPIIVAGLTIAIPGFIASTMLDSYYYGVLTVPQHNFIAINVLENLSVFFGVEPWHFFVDVLPAHFGWYFGTLFGLTLLSYR